MAPSSPLCEKVALDFDLCSSLISRCASVLMSPASADLTRGHSSSLLPSFVVELGRDFSYPISLSVAFCSW